MQGISDLSWDALGEKLCTASDDFTLKLWDVGKGECLRTLEGHTSYVFCCCFAPMGNALERDSMSAPIRKLQGRPLPPAMLHVAAGELQSLPWRAKLHSDTAQQQYSQVSESQATRCMLHLAHM